MKTVFRCLKPEKRKQTIFSLLPSRWKLWKAVSLPGLLRRKYTGTAPVIKTWISHSYRGCWSRRQRFQFFQGSASRPYSFGGQSQAEGVFPCLFKPYQAQAFSVPALFLLLRQIKCLRMGGERLGNRLFAEFDEIECFRHSGGHGIFLLPCSIKYSVSPAKTRPCRIFLPAAPRTTMVFSPDKIF